MTTSTRICAWREEYVGPWLPEPVVDTAALAPDSRTELAEDLSIALLFDSAFSEVATTLERSEAACRQLAARARARAMSAFAAATNSGDLNALMQLLASDVRVVTDGGGKVRAALNVIDGADRAFEIEGDVIRALYVVRNPDIVWDHEGQ